MSSTLKMLQLAVPALVIVAITAGAALAEDVVVDGGMKYLYPSNSIDNVTVKNGGMVWFYGEGGTVTGDVTLEGDAYVQFKQGSSWTINGDLLIAGTGSKALVYSTEIEGGVNVSDGGTLEMYFGAVDGNIMANKALRVALSTTTVGGKIRIKKGAAADIVDCTVEGDVTVDRNDHSLLRVAVSTIGGDLTVTDNVIQTHFWVYHNSVGGDLEVTGNDPKPTTYFVYGNSVDGDEEID